MQNTALTIIGFGGVTSVGRSIVQSCASIRAGISRGQALDYFFTVEPDSQELASLIGHPVQALTEGFLLYGTWQRLARAALSDLCRQVSLPSRDAQDIWHNTALVCVLPEHHDDRYQCANENAEEEIIERFLRPLLVEMGLDSNSGVHKVICSGHAGFGDGIEYAAKILAAEASERVIVLGVDSYLDGFCLEWLAASGRLKSGETPTGLAPGEAGVCVLLSAGSSPGQAKISHVVCAEDNAVEDDDVTKMGVGLADVLVTAGRTTDGRALPLLADQNGETWRAMQLAYARLRAAPMLDEMEVIMPMASVGDVGAAWGCLATACVVHEWRRKVRGESSMMVCASSDSGRVSAWRISRQETPQAISSNE